MSVEILCTFLPCESVGEGSRRVGIVAELQGCLDSAAQVPVHCCKIFGRIVGEYIRRPRHWLSRYAQAGRTGFHQDQSESVGHRGKDEQIGRSVMARQFFARQRTQKMHVRILPFQKRQIGAVADNNPASKSVDIEKLATILLNSESPNVKQDRAGECRKIRQVFAIWTKQIRIYAARRANEMTKLPCLEFLLDRFCRYHDYASRDGKRRKTTYTAARTMPARTGGARAARYSGNRVWYAVEKGRLR